MRKLLLIGPGGAGKSTLATRLGASLGLPVHHLDALYWRPGWQAPAREEWLATLAPLLAQDAWVMDGNFGGTLDERLAAADTAILLDLPPLLCLGRALRRRWRYRGRHRPDMAPGCLEKIDFEFVWWILGYRHRKVPTLLPKLRAWATAPGRRLVVLRSPREVEAFIRSLHAPRMDDAPPKPT
jgi:adenylate kinase family enzyme